MEQRYNKLIGRWETIYTKKVVETKEKSIKLVPNNRKELQELAKLHEIPANLSNDELKIRLNDILSQGE
jgi:hypothetical protein